MKNIFAVAAMAIVASLAVAGPVENRAVVVQNYYYAKPGKADQVYQWRLHASDVRVKLGFARGRVLRRINSGDAKELPDVIWECDYPTTDAREREAAAVGAAPEFQAVQKHMSTLIRRFERGNYRVESH